MVQLKRDNMPLGSHRWGLSCRRDRFPPAVGAVVGAAERPAVCCSPGPQRGWQPRPLRHSWRAIGGGALCAPRRAAWPRRDSAARRAGYSRKGDTAAETEVAYMNIWAGDNASLCERTSQSDRGRRGQRFRGEEAPMYIGMGRERRAKVRTDRQGPHTRSRSDWTDCFQLSGGQCCHENTLRASVHIRIVASSGVSARSVVPVLRTLHRCWPVGVCTPFCVPGSSITAAQRAQICSQQHCVTASGLLPAATAFLWA